MKTGHASTAKSAPMLLSNGFGRSAVVFVGEAVATLSVVELETELEVFVEVFEGAEVVVDSPSSFLITSSTPPLLINPPEYDGPKSHPPPTFGGGLVSSNTIPFSSSSLSSAAMPAPGSAGGTSVSGIGGGGAASASVKVRQTARRRREVRERGRYAERLGEGVGGEEGMLRSAGRVGMSVGVAYGFGEGICLGAVHDAVSWAGLVRVVYFLCGGEEEECFVAVKPAAPSG